MMKKSRHIDSGIINIANGEGDDAGDEHDTQGKARDFHKMLDTLLESYLPVQRNGFMWDLRYRGNTYMNLEFVPFVCFVKADTQEADVLCGSFTSRSRGVKQLCRYCVCPNQDTDNPQARWRSKTVEFIKPHCDRKDVEMLRKMSQQCIDNAWYKIRFSPIKNMGIHGSCPSEMLHAILLGIFPYVRNAFFEQIGPKSKLASEILGLSQMIGNSFARQSERDIPKCKFKNGITEGKLQAKEYRGILLVMAAILRSDIGNELLRTKDSFRTQTQRENWLELVELLLCWEAFLTQDTLPVPLVSKLSFKNRLVMWMIKKVARRSEGMQWKLMKFHAIVHMAFDINLYGVPNEVDTGSNEAGHKDEKLAAKLTQKNIKTFDMQTCTRLDEFLLIDLALEEMKGRKLWHYYDNLARSRPKKPVTVDDNDGNSKDALPEGATGGTAMAVFHNEKDNNRLYYSMGGEKKKTNHKETSSNHLGC